jgi:hypothetical protein
MGVSIVMMLAGLAREAPARRTADVNPGNDPNPDAP